MSVPLQHNVVQLQVPVDDALGVQEEQSTSDFGRIKHSDGLFELADLLDLIHQIAAVDEFHDEIETVLGGGGYGGKWGRS